MSNRVSSAVFYLVIAVAISFGSMLPPGTHSATYDPTGFATANAEWNAQIESEIAEHGHSHDDGEDHERTSGHPHGHNSADHAHETPATSPVTTNFMPASGRTWLVMARNTAHLGASYRLERPPRSTIVA